MVSYLRRSVILAVVAALSAPVVMAQSGDVPDDVAGDPRFRSDGADCFEALAAGSDAACTVVYAHLNDFHWWPILSVQRPADCLPDSRSGNYGMPGVESLWDFNGVSATSTTSWISYGDCTDSPFFHGPQRFVVPLELDPSLPLVGYWYLSADLDEMNQAGFDPQELDAGVLPCLTLRMSLVAGRITPDHAPRVLAVGETTKTVVSTAGGQGGTLIDGLPCPGKRDGDVIGPEDVTEFRVVLEPVSGELVVPAGYNLGLGVEWYSFAPGNPDDQSKLYPGWTNQHDGPSFPNRVVFGVHEPLRMNNVQPFAFEDKLAVRTELQSTWGLFDLDGGTVHLSVVDGSGADVPLAHTDPPILRRSVQDHSTGNPVTTYLLWDVLAEDLPPGVYNVTVAALNHQHTAEASASFDVIIDQDGGFRIPPDPTIHGGPETADAPGMGLGALVAFVLTAVWVAARMPRSFPHVHKNVK